MYSRVEVPSKRGSSSFFLTSLLSAPGCACLGNWKLTRVVGDVEVEAC